MISYTILASSPDAFRDYLIARGLVELKTGERLALEPMPVKGGLEWIEVPNILRRDGDTRRCYLVKMAHELFEDETMPEEKGILGKIAGLFTTPLTGSTKFARYAEANGAPETITAADGRSWASRRIGNDLWILENASDFGVWQ